MKARLPYIDQLKGLATMIVIIGHIILFCGLGWFNDYNTVIVMIQMPLFIFLNGLVVSELQNRGGAFLRKKFMQIMIPFFSWGALITLYKHRTYINFLTDFWKFGYWYLIVLFEFFVIYWLISIATPKGRRKIIDAVAFIGITLVGYLLAICAEKFIPPSLIMLSSYSQIPEYYPYFFLGVIIKRYNLSELLLKRPNFSTTLLFALLAVMLVLYGLLPYYKLIHIALRISIILSIYIIFLQSKSFGDSAIKRHSLNFLALVGRHSLAIYMIQFFLFALVDYHKLFAMLEMNPLILIIIAIATTIVMCYICILIEKIILLSRPLSFLLLGKPLNVKARGK